MTTPEFNPAWIPAKLAPGGNFDGEDWDEIPDGRGNNTLAAIGGAMRKQGASYHAILRSLLAHNKLFMDRDPMPNEMVEQIARSVSRYNPEPDIDIELVDDEAEEPEEEPAELRTAALLAKYYTSSQFMVRRPPPTYLWHPYMPDSRLVAVEGEEGIGKGLLGSWLAKHVIAGTGPNPGDDERDPRPVLWYSAEDDPEDDIYPRLLAAGYDPEQHERVHFFSMEKQLKLPKHKDHLREVVEAIKPGLIIFDPGRMFLAPEDERAEMSTNNEMALRPGLVVMNRIAHDSGVATLFVHHQNKGDGSSRQKSFGSIAIRQVCRQVNVVAMARDRRAIGIDKGNHIDRFNSVQSWDVIVREGQDIAQFVLGGKLPEYSTIDEWHKTVSEGDAEINVEITLADVRRWYARVDCGAEAPSVANIAKDLGVKKAVAAELRVEAVAARLIVDNKWQGCRAESAAKGEK